MGRALTAYLLAGAGLMWLTGCPRPEAVRYSAEWLPVKVRSDFGSPLNNWGDVAGSVSANPNRCAALWQNGRVTIIEGRDGFNGEAVGISNSGALIIVQYKLAMGYTNEIVIRENGVSHTVYSDWKRARAFAINDNLNGVGFLTDPLTRRELPVIWTLDGPVLLPIPEGVDGFAEAINAFDVAVGQAGTDAMRWENGVGTVVASLGGTSCAHSINDAGSIVGESLDGVYQAHPWVNHNGVVEALPCPGDYSAYPYGINSQGVVVGICFSQLWQDEFAVLWQHTGSGEWEMAKLSEGLSASFRDTSLQIAVDINDSGQILTFAYDGWMLLTPRS